jgi:dephospho-CoA kinase
VLVIGLTGGIGTGKTEVTRVLQELGAVVIESDRVAHQSYEPGTEAHKTIVSRFGERVLGDSGLIDRKVLGEIVFSDPVRLKELEVLVLPATHKLIETALGDEKKRGTKVVVIEVAKLYENGWDHFADTVWTVEAPEEQAVKRVAQRSGLSESDIKARIAVQMTSDERVERADTVIENNTTLEDLRNQISKLWESISH